MLKLHQIYLRKFLLLFFILFILIGGVVYYWLKDFYIEQTKQSLLQNIQLISYTISQKPTLEKISQNIKQDLSTRLTIIDKDGEILFESHEEKSTMDNHKYREEIIQSRNEHYGFIIRHSDTLNTDLLYVAKRFIVNGEEIFIRVSKTIESISDKIFQLGLQILFIVVIFFLIVLFVTYKISNQIQTETNRIMAFVSNLTKKQKNSYINSDFSHEFYQITKHLTKVSKILSKQDKLKTKYTTRLKKSNTQKDDIISAISHEFKNPIAVINGYSQTLLDDESINPKIQNKFLNKIYKNGLMLSKLIDTLRLSTKLEEKKQSLNYTNVNLHTICSDISETLQTNYPQREIVIDISSELQIKADETLLSLAITNLVENALKYSEDTVAINANKKYIAITDTGIGIKKQDIDKITQKFYRVSSNTWNNSLGLGLSIVSNIVSLHSFKLEIKSDINEGSEFKILF